MRNAKVWALGFFAALSGLVLDLSSTMAADVRDAPPKLIYAIAEAPHFAEFDQENKPHGPQVESAEHTIAESGLALQLELLPPARLLENFIRGDIAFIHIARHPYADAAGTYVEDVLQVPILAVARRGVPLSKPEDLGNVETIGFPRTFAGSAVLPANLQKKAVDIPDLISGMGMLKRQRIDVLVGTSIGLLRSAAVVAALEDMGEFIPVKHLMTGIYVSPKFKDKAAIDKLRATVVRIRDSGYYEAVGIEYFGPNWRNLGRPVSE